MAHYESFRHWEELMSKWMDDENKREAINSKFNPLIYSADAPDAKFNNGSMFWHKVSPQPRPPINVSLANFYLNKDGKIMTDYNTYFHGAESMHGREVAERAAARAKQRFEELEPVESEYFLTDYKNYGLDESLDPEAEATAVITQLIEAPLTRVAQYRYANNHTDEVFPNGSILVASCAFLSDTAAKDGKVKAHEYIMYKAVFGRWYATFYNGHLDLVSAFRNLRNTGTHAKLHIASVSILNTEDAHLLMNNPLPKNPTRAANYIDWE